MIVVPAKARRRPGPIRRDAHVERRGSTAFAQHEHFGVMGPGLRRDDVRCTHPAFRYPAKNICAALSTTCAMRSVEGGGAAWKMKGRNSEAWHMFMNCEAASWQSGIATSFFFTRTSR